MNDTERIELLERTIDIRDLQIKNFREDNLFQGLALNLSGRRRELQDEAERMIDTIGLKSALKKTRVNV